MTTVPAGARGSARRRRGTARNTVSFAFWTAISRVAGLAREIIAAALFGTRGAINAFVVAFQVPNLLRSLVADSALSAAFVPVFTELEEGGRHEEARRLAGALIGLIGAVLGLVSLLAVVTAPWVMPIFAPGLPDDLVNEMVRLAQVMFPIVVLLGLTGLVVGLLQTQGQFTASAFAPVLWNVVIIAALAGVAPFLDEDRRIYAYAFGIVAGTVVQLLFLLPALRGRGPYPISLGRGNPYVRRVLVLMLPVTLGLGLINVNASVDTVFATLVSEDSPRAIDAAFRLYILPQGVFSVAISTVLFPAIARLAAREDFAGMREAVSSGMRQIFFMLVPASAFLLVLAEPVTRLIYEHGEFDAASTALTSEALFFFTIGLTFNGASLLLIRAFFSLQRPWLPTKVAFGGLVLNAVLDLALYGPLGTGGIPLATSISSLATFLALAHLLSREMDGVDGRWAIDGFLRSLVASGLLGVLAWTSWRLADEALGRSLGAEAVSLAVAVGAALVAYAAAAQALSMPELRTLGRLLRPLR